jgi:hypothetical protein
MTLLMSTEELLAVLGDGVAMSAPQPRPPERRLQLVPPPPEPEAPAGSSAPDAASAPEVQVAWKQPAAPVDRPSLRVRLHCARHGHDPRPHRTMPHDPVVYRCLRCGQPTPAPLRIVRP